MDKHNIYAIDSRNILSTNHSTSILQNTSNWSPPIWNLNLSMQRCNLTFPMSLLCVYIVFVLCTHPFSLWIGALKIWKYGVKKTHGIFFAPRENHIPIWSLHFISETSLGPTGHIVKKSTANQSISMPGERLPILLHFWWIKLDVATGLSVQLITAFLLT